MAFNGSGTFVRLFNWATDLANGTKIRADRMDSEMDGFATGLTTCLTKDGQTTTTARIPFAAGIQLNTGTVGAPATNFNADLTTGTYSPGAGQWAVAATGTQRFLVNGAAISVTGTFSVSGASTFTGAVTCSAALSVVGDFAVNTNKFTVAAASGNTAVAGTLAVTGTSSHTGNATFGGTLGVTGATTLAALTATGNVSFSGGNFTVAAATGNTVVGGTFQANGATVLASTLAVSGAATLTAGGTAGGNPITNFPSGTVMLFAQTSAPTGWTKGATHNNKALRVVTGVASSGGTTAFTSVFASRTILQGNLPSFNLNIASLTATDTGHTHGYGGTVNTNTSSTVGAANALLQSTNLGGTPQVTSFFSGASASGSSSISMGGTLPSGGSGTPMDFDVQYVDVIIATKD